MQVNHIIFHDDLNIHHIYSEVIDALKLYIAQKDAYEKEYRRLRKISVMSHNPADRARATTIMREMEKLLPRVRDGTLPDSYMKEASIHLLEYSKLCGFSRVFGMDKCTNVPKRVGIILSFLETTKEYSKITWECSYNMEKICPKCYATMRKCGPIMICDSCGYSHKIERMLGVLLDGSRIKTESTYDASKNFRKEYMHVCGVIHDMKDGEKEDIESYIYRAGFKNPSRENIRDGIRTCGYNNYHDTNYIYHQITEEPLPNIYPYLDVCTIRFDQYFKAFHALEDREGQNITNIHFLIKLHLWQEGIPYEECWFRSLSEQTETKHRRNAKKVCNVLKGLDNERKWEYPPAWDIIKKPCKQTTSE